MGLRQPLGDLTAQPQHLMHGHRPLRQALRESLTLNQLQDDGVAVARIQDVEYLDDQRMVQTGGGSCLAAQALAAKRGAT